MIGGEDVAANDGRALTPFAANIACIALMLIIGPAVMNWGMTQGYESKSHHRIEDGYPGNWTQSNYVWTEAGNCSIYYPSSTAVSTMAWGENYTYLLQPSGGASGSVTSCGFGPYELQVPHKCVK